MPVLDLDEVRRRDAQMEAARRMGTQAGLPEPTPEQRALEDRVVTGELTVEQAVAQILGNSGRSA